MPPEPKEPRSYVYLSIVLALPIIVGGVAGGMIGAALGNPGIPGTQEEYVIRGLQIGIGVGVLISLGLLLFVGARR